MEKHYYCTYNGMSVPNGHTKEYISDLLKEGIYCKFSIIEMDGFIDEVIYIGKEENKYKFKRCFNNEIVFYTLYQIHLLEKI